jgi:hypothetical protein
VMRSKMSAAEISLISFPRIGTYVIVQKPPSHRRP